MKQGEGEQPEPETKELNAPWKPENEAQEEEQKAKADYFRDLGAEVDNNGNVVLYHATTEAAVRQIEKEGFRPNEDPINGIQIEEVKPRSFFGYDRQWIEDTWATKDSKIMKIRVPAYFLHQAGQNTDEVFIEGWIHKKGKVWLPDEDPTSLAWDRRLVKRWKKRNS